MPGRNLAGVGKVSLINVRGTANHNAEQVLYLFRAHDAVGMKWAAAHGPPEAYYEDVATATPVFGSPDENILMAGSPEWHRHPCML